MTHKRCGAVALSSRLSTKIIGSFADKPSRIRRFLVLHGGAARPPQSGRPANEEDMDTMAKKAKKAKKTKKAKAKKKK